MKLNDPQITIKLESLAEELQLLEFRGKDLYCPDGFPKEGDQCYLVLPSP